MEKHSFAIAIDAVTARAKSTIILARFPIGEFTSTISVTHVRAAAHIVHLEKRRIRTRPDTAGRIARFTICGASHVATYSVDAKTAHTRRIRRTRIAKSPAAAPRAITYEIAIARRTGGFGNLCRHGAITFIVGTRIAVIPWIRGVGDFFGAAETIAYPHFAIARGLDPQIQRRSIRFGLRLTRIIDADRIGASRRSAGTIRVAGTTHALAIVAFQIGPAGRTFRLVHIERHASAANVIGAFQAVDFYVEFVFDDFCASFAVTNDHLAIPGDLVRDRDARTCGDCLVYTHLTSMFEAFALLGLGCGNSVEQCFIALVRRCITRIDGARIVVIAIGSG